MAGKRDKPEEIVAKLRQVEVLQGKGVGFRREAQRDQAKLIFTSFPSSASIASMGVLKPRYFRGVELRVMAISWMSSSLNRSRSMDLGSQRLILPLVFSNRPSARTHRRRRRAAWRANSIRRLGSS